MTSRQKDHQKAESILHHLLRLGSKVTNPIKKRRRKRFWKKRLKEFQRQASFNDSVATNTTLLHASTTAHHSQSWYDEDGTPSPHIPSQDREDYLDELLSVSSSDHYDDDKVKTIDQNGLLVECFMGNDDGNNIAFVVHFFNDDSTISEEIDNFLETRLLDHNLSSLNWKCRRMNARLAPLFAKILDIDPEQPTVVAIKDGIMVTKQTELSPPVVEPQLQRWMTTTENIISGEQESISDFDYDDDDDDYSSEEEEDYSSDEEDE